MKGKTMTTKFIDADAAKLAGLLTDTLQKLRNEQMTLGQLEQFNNLTLEDREARFGDNKKSSPAIPTEPPEKFVELVDLGIITVPADYVHGTRLTTFGEKNGESFYYYNPAITDQNFPTPSRILKPGDKLRVRAFKQAVSGTTTSEERMAFLATKKAVYVGAQGASLVWEQKRNQLPKGFWYVSMDKKENLWKDAVGNHGVPYVRARSVGGFSFNLGYFEEVWLDDDVLLCFCDE